MVIGQEDIQSAEFGVPTIFDQKEFTIDFNGTLSGFFTAYTVIREVYDQEGRSKTHVSPIIGIGFAKIRALFEIVNNSGDRVEKFRAVRDAATILQYIGSLRDFKIDIIERVDEDASNSVQPVVADAVIKALANEGLIVNEIDNDHNSPGTKIIATSKSGKDYKIQRINTWRFVPADDKVDDEGLAAIQMALKTAGVTS